MKKIRLLSLIIATLLLIPANIHSVKATDITPDQISSSNKYLEEKVYVDNNMFTGDRYIYLRGQKADRPLPIGATIDLVASVNGKEYVVTLDKYSGLEQLNAYSPNDISGLIPLDEPIEDGDLITYKMILRDGDYIEQTETSQFIIDNPQLQSSPKKLPTPIIKPIKENDTHIELIIPNADQIDFEGATYSPITIQTGFESMRIDSYNLDLSRDMIDKNNEIYLKIKLDGSFMFKYALAFEKLSAIITGLDLMEDPENGNWYLSRYSSSVATEIVTEESPLANYEIEAPYIDPVKKTDDKITGYTEILPYYLGEKINLDIVLRRADGTKISAPINSDGSFSIPVIDLNPGELLNTYVQAKFNGTVKNGPTVVQQVAKDEESIPGDKGEPGDKGDPGDKGEPGIPGNNGQDGLDGIPGISGKNGLPGIKGADGLVASNIVSSSFRYEPNKISRSSLLPKTGEEKTIWTVVAGLLILIIISGYSVYRWKINKKG
ncbi:hypothetical protein RD055328_02810 [Companilactobacillus sp. RD055328]|uniref:LPXTG cell wall anchor domain-containing protein n=1 Tax=Companilactobacillus sp. RD055328 TaxID=2916634 RepID=UPI001FC8D63D|nr:LPXTG cell wall anchor domain-containing protein [Companilactobacillus sp. RD055328]GKQ42358.1 hypothetical protein RD055328_02810 [Companilactobacillus sp. RD055328]